MSESLIRINTDYKTLDEILKIVELKGMDISGKIVSNIKSFLLIVGDEIKVNVETVDGSTYIFAKLELEHEGKGEIPIDIDIFLTMLKRFKDKDKIILFYDKEKNVITLVREKPFLEIPFQTISAEHVLSTNRRENPISFESEIPKIKIREQTFSYGLRIDLDSSSFKDVIDDSKIGKLFYYPVKFVDNKLIATTKINNFSQITREIIYNTIKKFDDKDIECIFGDKFTSIFSNLTGRVRIYLSNNLPMYIIKESKNYKIEIILMNSIVEDEFEDEFEEVELN